MSDVVFQHPRIAEAHDAVQRILSGERADAVESQTLDCKEDITRRDLKTGAIGVGSAKDDAAARYYADEAACLANGEGGVLLIGIDDKQADRSAFVGTGLHEDWLAKRIREFTNPKLAVTATELQAAGQRIIALLVPRNDGNVPIAAKVSRTGWRTARRLGTDCEEMDFAAQMAWVQSRQGYDWSAQSSGKPIVEARGAGVDAVRDFLRESGEPDRAALADLSDPDMISKLQLVHDDGTLNNAGALLLCAAPEARLKYLYRPAPGAVSTTRIESGGRSLAEELRRVLDAIEIHNPSYPLEGHGLAIGSVHALDPLAVREALVNGIMHRDWDVVAPVDIEQVGGEVIVFSPGEFWGGVTEQTVLTTASKTRNPRLASVLRSLRIAERESIGVQRMYVAMIRLGHAPPVFRQRDGGVRVALVGGPPVQPVLAVYAQLPDALKDSARFAVALHLLRTQTSITATELATAAQDEVERAQATLEEAAALGSLQRTANPRPDGAPAWRLTDTQRETLGPVLPYYARPTEESLRLVRQLAAHQGTVRNRDVQDLLGVSDIRASTLLKRAEQEEFI